MKLKRFLSYATLLFVSCFANASETQNETSVEASSTFCFWIFCEFQNSDVNTLGIGFGDPPVSTLGIGFGDPPRDKSVVIKTDLATTKKG